MKVSYFLPWSCCRGSEIFHFRLLGFKTQLYICHESRDLDSSALVIAPPLLIGALRADAEDAEDARVAAAASPLFSGSGEM